MNKKDLRILIVDDFELPRRLIRTMLEELGYESYEHIFEAADGLEAIEILKAHEIDLIISDWVMPKMTGIDFLKAVRKSEKLAKTPFIMVTAEAEKGNIMEAIREGVSQYIVKPFNASTLYQKMQSAMGM